jgi:uncharacterized membrane protein
MKRIDAFARRLAREILSWTADGIITEDLKNKILSLYLPDDSAASAPVKGKKEIHLPYVIAALAALCLAVGLIIFYASNWRKMPPSLKLAQVFLLIISAYGAAWYFKLKGENFAGKIFLNLGMVTFGVGIMLVAQIYHISSHPTNGIMAWAIGTLAVAALMKERTGLYLAGTLFFIWNAWEVFEYGNPAYFYIIPVIIIGILFYSIQDKAGIVMTALLWAWYYLQVNIYWITEAGSGEENRTVVFILSFFALGILHIVLGKFLRFNATLRGGGYVLSAGGWFAFMLPILFLSWPFKIKSAPLPAAFSPEAALQSWEYLFMLVIAGAGIFLLRQMQEPVKFYLPLFFFAIVFFFVPPSVISARLISMHSAIIILSGALLYLSFTEKGDRGFERAFSFVFVIFFLFVKWFGFLIYSNIDHKYKIIYLAGFILFAVVCFLINRTVKHLTDKEGKGYASAPLDIICSILVWITLYTASFKIENQASIFEADSIVIIMIALFAAFALILYSFLLSAIREKRLIIYLSMAMFVFSGITLFISGPDVSWIIYSLVFNLLLLLASGAGIWYSTVIQSRVLLNFSIAAFVIHIGTRYFDLFWDMLSGSLLFIITGIIGLLGGYVLEKKRRQMISIMEKDRKSSHAGEEK